LSDLESLLSRYCEPHQRVIKKYFETLKKTRRSGKIADSVLIKEMKYWERFPQEVVVEGLTIHIKKYPQKREAYTRGIIRQLNRENKSSGRTKRGEYNKRVYKTLYMGGKGDGTLPFSDL